MTNVINRRRVSKLVNNLYKKGKGEH